MERCVDCIHYKACEDWVISFRNYEETTFPYESENNLCEYYAPVVHGKWLTITNGLQGWKCSLCDEHIYVEPPRNVERYLYPFCPGCGVRMTMENTYE